MCGQHRCRAVAIMLRCRRGQGGRRSFSKVVLRIFRLLHVRPAGNGLRGSEEPPHLGVERLGRLEVAHVAYLGQQHKLGVRDGGVQGFGDRAWRANVVGDLTFLNPASAFGDEVSTIATGDQRAPIGLWAVGWQSPRRRRSRRGRSR